MSTVLSPTGALAKRKRLDLICKPDDFASPTAFNAYFAANAGQEIVILAGDYLIDNLADPTELRLLAGTKLVGRGKVRLRFANPSRAGFHLDSGCDDVTLENFEIAGDNRGTGSVEPGAPSFDWPAIASGLAFGSQTPEQQAYSTWAATWNAAHPISGTAHPALISTTLKLKDAWAAAYPNSPLAGINGNPSSNRGSAVIAHDCHRGRIQRVTASRYHVGLNLIGMATATAQMQDWRLDDFVMGDDIVFGILAAQQYRIKIRRFSLAYGVAGSTKGHADPHCIYLSNEPSTGNRTTSALIQDCDFSGYTAEIAVKTKVCFDTRLENIKGDSIAALLALTQGSTGSGRDLIVTNQTVAQDGNSRFAINILDCPGFAFSGVCSITAGASGKGIDIENSQNITGTFDYTCVRTAQVTPHKMKNSSLCDLKLRYADSGSTNSTILAMGANGAAGGSCFDSRIELLRCSGTTNQFAVNNGSARNRFVVNPLDVVGGIGKNFLINNGIGVSNVIIRSDGVRQEIAVASSFSMSSPATGRFTLVIDESPDGNGDSQFLIRNPADNDTLTMGSTTYRFKSALASAFDVLRGTDGYATLINLDLAIRGANSAGLGAGTYYGNGTTANTQYASSQGGESIDIAALTRGTTRNGDTLSYSGNAGTWSNTVTATGGMVDQAYDGVTLRVTTGANAITVTLPATGTDGVIGDMYKADAGSGNAAYISASGSNLGTISAQNAHLTRQWSALGTTYLVR